MEDKNEFVQQRVVILSEKLNDFLIKECEKENYLAAELYMAIAYLKVQFERALGKEFVKKMEQSFTIVDLTEAKEC